MLLLDFFFVVLYINGEIEFYLHIVDSEYVRLLCDMALFIYGTFFFRLRDMCHILLL